MNLLKVIRRLQRALKKLRCFERDGETKILTQRNCLFDERKGYKNFSINKHTELWKARNAKDPKHSYGVLISKTWYWYETWLKEVQQYCEAHSDELKG